MNYSDYSPYANNYPALKIVIGCFKFFGALIVVLGILALFINYPYQGEDAASKILVSVGIMIGLSIVGLVLFAFAEILKILIDIEHNTNMNNSIKDSVDSIKKNMDVLIQKQMDNDI